MNVESTQTGETNRRRPSRLSRMGVRNLLSRDLAVGDRPASERPGSCIAYGQVFG